MIIDVWRPRIKKVNGKGIAVSYEMVDIGVFIKEKRKGWIVRYYCDSCKNDKIMTTTTHVLLNPKVVYNTLEKQTCRSCRSKISEYEIKKSHIPFDVIEKSVIESNFGKGTRIWFIIILKKVIKNIKTKSTQQILKEVKSTT